MSGRGAVRPSGGCLDFRGVRPARHGVLIDFQVADLDREVAAFVPIEPRVGPVQFPHYMSAAGESLGHEELDEAVRERAAAVVCWLEALYVWSGVRSGRACKGWERR